MNNKLSKDLAKSLSELVSIKNSESLPRYQTPFLDYLRVKCVGGKGGSPLENTNRSKKLSGPGYGGHGGSIYFKSTHLVHDFLHIDNIIKAKNGGDGSGTSRGLHASDSIINVPLGSILRKRVRTQDRTRCIFWHQFLKPDEVVMVAKGGRGGLGPSCFKKHDHRLAEVGESINVELELRLLNDVAFIGLPNSGKTSLISSLTSYMTRIGPEEGSTTRPHVAVLKFLDGVFIRVMDLPPLSPDTDNKLVNRITRHIYRSKLIVYVISSEDNSNLSNHTHTYNTNHCYYTNHINNTDLNGNFDHTNQTNQSYNINDHTHDHHTHESDHTNDTSYNNNTDQSDNTNNTDNTHNTHQNDHMETLNFLRSVVRNSKTFDDSKLELVVMTKCDKLHKNTLFNLDSLYYKMLDSLPNVQLVATSATHRLGLQRCVDTIRNLLYPKHVTYNKRVLVDSYEIKLLTEPTQPNRLS